MTDIVYIKEQYAGMTDGELENLLQADGLRPDALEALQQECNKRNILSGQVHQTHDRINDTKGSGIRDRQSKESERWWNAAINYACEQKFNGTSNDTILAGLMGMKASVEEALYIETNLGKLARERLDEAVSDRIAGITKAVCGIAVVVIAMLAALGNKALIVAGIIMTIGLVQIANATLRKSRYLGILQKIAEETNDSGDGEAVPGGDSSIN